MGAVAAKAVTPHVKGVALEHFLEWYGRSAGRDRLDTLVASLPEGDRAALGADRGRITVLASGWYDAALVHRLLDGMSAGLDDVGRTRLAEGAAEAIVRTNLRGIYKVLFQLFMTPERYASRAQALWERYFDGGVITKTVDGPKRHSARIESWAGHHPLLCEMNAAAGRIIYEELGCKNVRSTRTHCVAKGDAACAQVITWD